MPTRQPPYPFVLACLFVLLSFLDLLFTLLLGPACEANPLAIWIWRGGGWAWLVLAKIYAVLSVIGFTFYFKEETAARLFCFGIGAEAVAIISLAYFWSHMPKVIA